MTHIRTSARRLVLPITLGIALALLVACGGGPTPSAPQPTAAGQQPAAAAPQPTAVPATSAKLLEAVFAKSLSESQEPVDPTGSYTPEETIYLSLRFDGRPKTGTVRAEFLWHDDTIADAEVDFADANSGVIISIGQDTFAGFNLNHEKPLYISDQYRADIFLDGEKIGSYPFAVVPPSGAIPSSIADVTLARGAEEDYRPIDPTSEFGPEETVFLVGSGDLGNRTWLQAEWYVGGKIDQEGTRSITLEEDAAATGFSFSYLPEGGWKEGEHEVVLIMNDEEVGRYAFTVASAAPSSNGTAPRVAVGDLTTYTAAGGLFRISVPENWELQEDLSGGTVSFVWLEPGENAGIFVNILGGAEALDEQQLTEYGNQFVQQAFGSEDNFTIYETTTQSDGSILLAWGAEVDADGGALEVTGLTYVEQRGDKLSYLTTVVPADQYDELWESALKEIVNSYRIDEAAELPSE